MTAARQQRKPLPAPGLAVLSDISAPPARFSRPEQSNQYSDRR
jgi:hypothetical protein